MPIARAYDIIRAVQQVSEDMRVVEIEAAARLLAQLETWHNFGDPNEPGFVNGWVAGTGGGQPGYLRDRQGFVHLRGTVHKVFNMTGNTYQEVTLTTLPLNYRPPGEVDLYVVVSWLTTGGIAKGRCRVTTAGDVILGLADGPGYGLASADHHFWLDNCHFRVV